MIVSLEDYLELQGKSKINDFFHRYHCSRDPDVERFLKERSLIHNYSDISKTYLAVDDISGEILGYVTVAIKCMMIGEGGGTMSNRLYRSLNVNHGVVQSYLIGQLSRSDDSEKGIGSMLIKSALVIFDELRRKVGCRVVRLDCKDEMIPYYESQGFHLIRKNSDSPLNQMVMLLA